MGDRYYTDSMNPVVFDLNENHDPDDDLHPRDVVVDVLTEYSNAIHEEHPGRATRLDQMIGRTVEEGALTVTTPGEASLVRDSIDHLLVRNDGSIDSDWFESVTASDNQQKDFVEYLQMIRRAIVQDAPIQSRSYVRKLSQEDRNELLLWEREQTKERMQPEGDTDYTNSVLNDYVRSLGIDNIIHIHGPETIEEETGIDLPPGNPFEAYDESDFLQKINSSPSSTGSSVAM